MAGSKLILVVLVSALPSDPSRFVIHQHGVSSTSYDSIGQVLPPGTSVTDFTLGDLHLVASAQVVTRANDAKAGVYVVDRSTVIAFDIRFPPIRPTAKIEFLGETTTHEVYSVFLDPGIKPVSSLRPVTLRELEGRALDPILTLKSPTSSVTLFREAIGLLTKRYVES